MKSVALPCSWRLNNHEVSWVSLWQKEHNIGHMVNTPTFTFEEVAISEEALVNPSQKFLKQKYSIHFVSSEKHEWKG